MVMTMTMTINFDDDLMILMILMRTLQEEGSGGDICRNDFDDDFNNFNDFDDFNANVVGGGERR